MPREEYWTKLKSAHEKYYLLIFIFNHIFRVCLFNGFFKELLQSWHVFPGITK